MQETKVVHIKKEPYDVYIGRPSIWGNPYSHKEDTLAEFKVRDRKESIEKFEKYLTSNKEAQRQNSWLLVSPTFLSWRYTEEICRCGFTAFLEY